MSDELPFRSRRSTVHATGGMVATSQPLAAMAGVRLLLQGGNAVDAAVATAAALFVTEPVSCGPGGDCFALFHPGGAGEVWALNGSGRAPAGLTLERIRAAGLAELQREHALSITVPGAIRGLCDLHARCGSRPLGDVLAPAISLAEQGFPVAPLTAQHWAEEAEKLARQPGGAQMLIAGRAPRTGEPWKNPGLAHVLRAVAMDGPDAFYRGPIAATIGAAVVAAGGVLTGDDLAAHESTWGPSISTSYRGVRVHEHPPNGQGIAALLALNVLAARDAASHPPLSAARLHETIEALRLAFADARAFVADPAHASLPVAGLLDMAYAKARAALIEPRRAAIDPRAGSPLASSETVYLSTIDGAGRACSLICSNYTGTGTGIAPPGLGFTLQNRGLGFSLEHGHPNCVAPGKRPYHTIIPALLTREDGALLGSFGVMGGYMQPQGHVQVVQALLDDGLDPQAALDRPRVMLLAGEPAGGIAVEEGIDEGVVATLAAMGHRIEPIVTGHGRELFGRGQVILRDPSTGVLSGGSDPRADGCAIGV